MALKSNSIHDVNIPGIKVEGELNDFQIIEEHSDSDDDGNTTVSRTSGALDIVPNLPTSLVKPSSPVCGNVAVTNSENVIIGNTTYFNGPVTIQQVIQNASGVENTSYVKTEDEDVPVQHYKQEAKNDATIKRFHIQKWYKVTFSIVCIVILGGVLAILSVIIMLSNNHDNRNSQDGSSLNGNDEDSTTKSNFTRVVGIINDNFHLILTIMVMPLIIVLASYTLLTLDDSVGDKNVVTDTVKFRQRKDSEDLDDDYDPYMKPVKKANPLIIAPDHLRIVPRTDWLAQPVDSKLLDKIRQPVPWVIISHTATESCNSQSECVLRVRLIQTFHIESRNWDDIGYNFLVAGDGSAYYGRGWDYIGAHTLGYNKYSIGISFVGTFNTDTPPKKQVDACKKLLKRGVALGKLAKDYKLFAHRQLASTLSPGDTLYDIIKEWPHFVKNFTDVSELLPNYKISV